MNTYHMIISGVEEIWLIWGIACLLLAIVTRFLFRTVRVWNTWRLFHEERGAAYTLGIVLLLPFYTLLMATVVDCTLLLVVKTGTAYAAFTAARAAAVWHPESNFPPPQAPDSIPAEAKIRQVSLAAIRAMWPFASGSRDHQSGGPGAFLCRPEDLERAIAGRRGYSKGAESEDYLKRKWQYAAKATQVDINCDSTAFNAKYTVTVTYEAPIHLPGVGRLLGRRSKLPGASYFSRAIVSSAIIEREGAKSQNQSLGIRYYH